VWQPAGAKEAVKGVVPGNHLQLTHPRATQVSKNTLFLPSGAISRPDGSFRFPDGSWASCDGQFKLADGTQRQGYTPEELSRGKLLPDFTLRLADDTVQYPSGAHLLANGTLGTTSGAIIQPKWAVPPQAGDGAWAEPKPMPEEERKEEGPVNPLATYHYEGLYNWDAAQEGFEPGQLTFSEGDLLTLLSKQTETEGWWHCRLEMGEEGLVPYNYLQLVSDQAVLDDEENVILPSGAKSSGRNDPLPGRLRARPYGHLQIAQRHEDEDAVCPSGVHAAAGRLFVGSG
jgi:hypothetical protein